MEATGWLTEWRGPAAISILLAAALPCPALPCHAFHDFKFTDTRLVHNSIPNVHQNPIPLIKGNQEKTFKYTGLQKPDDLEIFSCFLRYAVEGRRIRQLKGSAKGLFNLTGATIPS